MIQLYDYQKKSVITTEDFDGTVLLSLEMGLGKTIISAKCLERNRDWMPTLIVCPASVKYNWQYELRNVSGINASICESRTPPRRSPNHSPSVLIINYDILKDWEDYLTSLGINTLILDECHTLKNRNTQRTRAARRISRHCNQVMALSGTPLTGRPRDLWPTLNILWPEHYGSFREFGREFCKPRLTPWGWKYDGAEKLDILHRRLKEHGMVRYRKEDVLKDLPKKVRSVIACELADPKEYERASENFLAWLTKTKPHKAAAARRAQALTRIGELLRLCAKLKLRQVVEWSNRFLEETGEKLVIFAHHKAAVKVFKKRVVAPSVLVTGDVTGRKRQDAIDRFNEDPKTRVFIGNILAGGTGINIQKSASNMVFAEISWLPTHHMQAEDRIHRIGQTKPTWINYMVAGGTIEERLCRLLQRRQEQISAVLDGKKFPSDLNIYNDLLKELDKGKV